MNYSRLILLICIFAMLSVSQFAHGQETKITGVIKDSLSNAAEVSAIVQFYKSEDNTKPIAYTTTNENGVFTHNLSVAGDYRLYLDNLGKKKTSVLFTVADQPEIDLGTILVQDDATHIQAGTVTAFSKLVEINVDVITYKVSIDAEAKTKSVLDILRKVPLVSVDGLGRITVNGNTSFLVYMDGKKNQLMSDNPSEVFRSMPASMVKDIEVITDPGARYDAEGVGGVLNITSNFSAMNPVSDGLFNGTVSLGGSLRKLNAGAFVSAKKNKWTVSFSLSGVASRSGETGLSTERVQNLANGQMTTVSSGILNDKGTDVFGDLSASYEINSNNLITFSAGVIDILHNEQTELFSSIDVAGNKYEYGENSISRTKNDIFNTTIDYQHTSKNKPGRIFVISYQLNGRPSKLESDNFYTPGTSLVNSLNDRKDYVLSNSMTHVIQSDLILPLAKRHRLSMGEKIAFRHNKSDNTSQIKQDGTYVSDTQSDLNYDFYNNIGALYAEYNGTINKFKLRGGLRYEHTWQKAMYNELEEKDFRLNYGNLVPNASIQYDINDTQNLGLSYSMSIRRPGITYLNPYVNTSDPSSIVYGNPYLKAENGHQIGISYNVYSGKWIVMMKVQQVFKNNGISPYTFYDADHIMNTTYGNVVKSSRTGVNSYISWSPAQKTRISFNGTASYNIINSEKLDMNATGWLFDAMVNVEQILPAEVILNFSVSYMPNSMTLQSRTSGIWNSMLSVSKSFCDNRLNVSLTGTTNISNQMRASMKTVTTGADFVYTNETLMPWKDVSINLSYSFGGQDRISVTKSRKKKMSDDQLDIE